MHMPPNNHNDRAIHVCINYNACMCPTMTVLSCHHTWSTNQFHANARMMMYRTRAISFVVEWFMCMGMPAPCCTTTSHWTSTPSLIPTTTMTMTMMGWLSHPLTCTITTVVAMAHHHPYHHADKDNEDMPTALPESCIVIQGGHGCCQCQWDATLHGHIPAGWGAGGVMQGRFTTTLLAHGGLRNECESNKWETPVSWVVSVHHPTNHMSPFSLLPTCGMRSDQIEFDVAYRTGVLCRMLWIELHQRAGINSLLVVSGHIDPECIQFVWAG